MPSAYAASVFAGVAWATGSTARPRLAVPGRQVGRAGGAGLHGHPLSGQLLGPGDAAVGADEEALAVVAGDAREQHRERGLAAEGPAHVGDGQFRVARGEPGQPVRGIGRNPLDRFAVADDGGCHGPGDIGVESAPAAVAVAQRQTADAAADHGAQRAALPHGIEGGGGGHKVLLRCERTLPGRAVEVLAGTRVAGGGTPMADARHDRLLRPSGDRVLQVPQVTVGQVLAVEAPFVEAEHRQQPLRADRSPGGGALHAQRHPARLRPLEHPGRVHVRP